MLEGRSNLYNLLTTFLLIPYFSLTRLCEGCDSVHGARAKSAALILFACVLVVSFGVLASRHVNLATATAIYLFVTLTIADRAGFVAASVVSVIATLCLEFFFAPPLFSFRVDRPDDWLALATFEGVSLVVSRLSHRARHDKRALERQSVEQQALYELCRDTLLLDWKQAPEQQLCALIKRSFAVNGVALWNAYEHALQCCGETPNAEDTLKAVYFNERNYDDTSTRASFRALYFGTRAVGALMLNGHSLDSLSISSIASITAMAIERARSLTLEMNIEAERQSEQLRSALLDGFAHAFKTPLTTITVASSGLLAVDGLNKRQMGLIALINREATRLSELTTRLLNTSRLEASQLVVHEKVTNLQELLRRVIEECALELRLAHVDLSLALGVESIRCDPQLLAMAITQILDNAAKYGSHGSRLLISAKREASEIVLRIHNEGSYIPAMERTKVFARYYRSPRVEHRAPGTGLGLSVAKKAVEAHGGKISIESDVQAGTTFVIAIPAERERTA
jgi:two-component system, OmpR family, sensor histidine kinase KdpD